MRDKPVLLIILTFRMGVASELAGLAGFESARHPLLRLNYYANTHIFLRVCHLGSTLD